MIYIECPEQFEFNSHPVDGAVTLFMGGGISGCPDWQLDLRTRLADANIILINPRRSVYDMDDISMVEPQISYEHYHLHNSEAIMFWFPEETLCPITLLELGKYLMTGKKLIVGCHPGYKRKLDVIIQTRLERPEVVVRSSLDEIEQDIRAYIKTMDIW